MGEPFAGVVAYCHLGRLHTQLLREAGEVRSVFPQAVSRFLFERSSVMPSPFPTLPIVRIGSLMAASGLILTACAAPEADQTEPDNRDWAQIAEAAQGQEVSLWMYGGDPAGNAYVDEHLIPAAEEAGVDLRRVPVADTKDAINRVLTEVQAGSQDGDVDLIWVNGDNFATVQQAQGWRCDWVSDLPNAQFLDPEDPLLTSDFGVDVAGCEAPWHKAQFTFVYDADRVEDPPSSMDELLDWAEQHPGRFTYPAPPDFTGSVFIRQALYAVSGGYE
ncbi:MAG: ABC transporter substrate-binding protein, partial [Ornithinimicrobium sp.]